MSFFPAILAVSMGLNTAYNRMTVQWQNGSFSTTDYHDLTKTLEMVCWGTACMLLCICSLLSGPISVNWLKASYLPANTIQWLIVMMAANLSLQVPLSLYIAGFNGLQRQIVPNIIMFVSFLFQGAGGLAIAGFFKHSLVAYFAWLLIVNGFTVIVTRIVFVCNVLQYLTGRIHWAILKNISGMAMEAGGTVLLGVCMIHTDKVLLSGLLDLDDYGVYSLAWFVASGIYLLANPIFTAIFPRMTEMLEQNSEGDAVRLYHTANQYMTCLVFPPALTVIFFSEEVLLAWTGNASVAGSGAFVLSMLMIGCLLNTLGYVPYAAQLAHKWAILGLYLNAASVLIYIPVVIIFTKIWGTTGAALAWSGLFVLLLPISLFIMHQKIMRQEFVSTITRDLIPAALAVAGMQLLWKMVIPQHPSRNGAILWVISAGFTSLLAALLSTETIRQSLVAQIRLRLSGKK